MIVLVVFLFGLMALSDFPPLIKGKKKYELVVLSCMYAGVFTLAAMMVFDMILPSPIKGVQSLIVDVLKIGFPEP